MKDKNLLVMINDDCEDHEIFEIAISEIDSPLELMYFSDCEKALEHFGHEGVNAPGFVFIDLNLPRMRGDECLVQLQQLREFDHPNIVIYSTTIPVLWHEKLEAMGVNIFLEKSGSIDALIRDLKKLLGK